MNTLIGMFPSILMIVSPILITAIGGMICERSGVVNIALEGLMAMGAFTAAALHVILETTTGGAWWSLWAGLIAGTIVGALVSLIHAYAAISLNADQTVSGTGINLLADGLTIFFAQKLFNADRTVQFQHGFTAGIAGIYPTAFIALAVLVGSWFLLYKLPCGLRLRACGEHPQAAASAGINVKKIRYAAVITSGGLAGLAGGCLVLTYTIQYTSNTINGAGFIALAAVAFGRWKPLGVFLASLLFGTASTLSILYVNFEILRLLPSEFFTMIPFIITLITLIIFSGRNYAPIASGKPFEQGAS